MSFLKCILGCDEEGIDWRTEGKIMTLDMVLNTQVQKDKVDFNVKITNFDAIITM